jgi:PAS domain S-box-containing protein
LFQGPWQRYRQGDVLLGHNNLVHNNQYTTMDSTRPKQDSGEAERLAALRHYNILDTLPEQGYDDVTKLAAFICGVPIALVSLVTEDRQWFKSEYGLGSRETARELSFCAHTIESREMLIVKDAQVDPRFKENALVTGNPHIRFYAGAPIIDPGGHVLGTVCVIDREPREITEAQVEALESLARQTMTLMQQGSLRQALEEQVTLHQESALVAQHAVRVAERTQEQLTRTAERLALAQKASGATSFDWDLETDTIRWSGDCFGRRPEEMPTAADVLALLTEEQRGPLRETIETALRDGAEYHHVFSIVAPDGELLWFRTTGKPLLDETGKVATVVGVNRDITESRRVETALLQTEKLAAVGRLASSIAHEINNPLEAVTNLLFLARQEAVEDDVQAWLDQADAELRRVSVIVNQTLRFHRQSTSAKAVEGEHLFQVTLNLYEARLRNSNVRVERRMRATRPIVCFEGDMRQVMSNLLSNAIDAMPQGGRLLVRSREATDWQTGVKGVALTIADTGTGMDAAVRKRVFEAFYSTKGIGGSGLGLWISLEILKRHGGRLMLRSSNGERHGTVVSLFLPFSEE